MKNDIRNIDLNLLKTLDVLLDERNVTRAAERLSLTQPAVSGMLTRLRESFDDPLFVRAQRGILPTLRALELAGPVKKILSDVESLLLPQAFDPATANMQLTIASTDYALRAVVVPFISALRQRAPGIRVSVVSVDSERLADQFDRGDIDMALVTPETAPSGLHAHRLFDESYVCLLRADHPAAAYGRLTLNHFCELDHALVSYSGANFSGVTDGALARLGRTRRVTLSVTSFLILPEILRVSDLIAVIPRRLAMPIEGLSILAPPLDIPGFVKTVAWHERTHRDIAHRWIRSLLFDVATQHPSL